MKEFLTTNRLRSVPIGEHAEHRCGTFTEGREAGPNVRCPRTAVEEETVILAARLAAVNHFAEGPRPAVLRRLTSPL